MVRTFMTFENPFILFYPKVLDHYIFQQGPNWHEFPINMK